MSQEIERFCFALCILVQVIWLEESYAYATSSNATTAIPDFNFAAVGDWACNPNTESTLNNVVDKNPELVLGLGDYSYQTSANCWLEIIKPIDEKMKIAIGNHERIVYAPPGSYESSVLLNQYMNHFNLTQQYYSFNYQNVHFTVMSPETSFNRGSEQYNFVNNDLAAASTNSSVDWIVAIMHEPIYNSPYYDNDGINSNLIEIYQPLFDKYRVDLVLSGDIHNYQRSYPLRYNPNNSSIPIITSTEKNNYTDSTTTSRGQIYLTVGTGGADLNRALTRQATFIARQQSESHGSLNVDLTNNGKTLEATFYANDGIVDDKFIISKAVSVTNSTTFLPSLNQSNFLTYENPDLGIKIETPVGWQQVEQGRGISDLYPVFLPVSKNSSAPPFFERLQIFVYDSQNRSLNELVTDEIEDFKTKTISDFNIIEEPRNNTLLADLSAYSLVYTGKEGPYDFKAQELWAMKGDKVYNILYIAPLKHYSTNLPIIQQMINSFEVTK